MWSVDLNHLTSPMPAVEVCRCETCLEEIITTVAHHEYKRGTDRWVCVVTTCVADGFGGRVSLMAYGAERCYVRSAMLNSAVEFERGG